MAKKSPFKVPYITISADKDQTVNICRQERHFKIDRNHFHNPFTLKIIINTTLSQCTNSSNLSGKF